MHYTIDKIQDMVKYKVNIFNFMKQILKSQILNHIKCALTRHIVSSDDEDELFTNPAECLYTTCVRCKYPLLLRRDPANPDDNYYMLMEA
jgi:hypothetical protein